jgi:hypothetical protein
LQVVTWQVPVEQDSAAFCSEHVEPQLPQLVSVVSEVSQPSFGSPLQLPQPVEQLGLQTPAEVHCVVPWAFVQETPQAPQLLTVVRLVSQPLETSPSQFAQPGLQEMPQLPALQNALPFVLLHTVPQLPQF